MKCHASQILTFIILTLSLVSCAPKGGAPREVGVSIVTEASLLRIYPDSAGELVEIVNPWDTTALLGSYYLTENPSAVVPEDAIMVRVPLERSAVFGTVHLGVIKELGALNRVKGVADVPYIGSDHIKKLVESGVITDLGSSMSPSLEKIIALRPDAMLVSPFENSGHGVLDNAGTALIEMADYMEYTPLGRAEWIRFIGRLYGCGTEADSIFEAVRCQYNNIAARGAGLATRPRVITEQVTDGYWFVPGGRSYMARLLTDAGADYPWADDTSAGSLQLDFGAVLARASDADYWLIRTYGHDLTLGDLKSSFELNDKIKAFSTGGVYSCNTAVVPLFDEFPFHPERLLEDYVTIFSGRGDGSLTYFRQVK